MDDVFSRLISDEEGFRPTVYDDANGEPIVPGYTLKGHPTIGYGRALDTHGISRAEGVFLRQADILAVKAQAESTYPWFTGLDEPRQAVVVSMVFNLGLGGFEEFHGLIAALIRGDFTGAAAEMLNSHWAKQVPSRATQLAEIMSTGQI